MKPELASELIGELDSRPLPTTISGPMRGPDGTTIEPERAVLLRVLAQDTAIRALLVDATKRRRDIEDWAGRVVALEEPTSDTAVPEEPHTPWTWIAAALVVGGSAALHLFEAAAIAWLWWCS